MSTTSAPTSEPTPTPQHFRRYRGRVWRIVEGQHRISTDRLVDDLDEQELLEALAEEVKPRMPEAARRLHRLLGTPFRYGYARGTRFRRAGERPGIFYACEAEATAVAEAAYYRLLFFARSEGVRLPRTIVEHTSFSVRVAAERCIDLTAAPFATARELWTSREDYEPCRRLAGAARAIGTQAIRYESARDPEHGMNLAVLDPEAFADRRPRYERSWHLRFEKGRLTAFAAFPSAEKHSFTFAQFGIVPANPNLL